MCRLRGSIIQRVVCYGAVPIDRSVDRESPERRSDGREYYAERQRVETISSHVEVENSSSSLGTNSSILREYVWTVDLMASAYLGHECLSKYSRDGQVAGKLSFETKTHRQDNGELMDDDKTRFAFYNRLTSVRLVL